MVFVLGCGWLVLAVFVVAAWPKINAEKSWRVGALLLTLAFSLLNQLVFSTVAEDAYITFRYALNIAEGYGPVFNPGEHVEGYSNFLWMIVIALPKAMFGWDIVVTASVFGVLCALGCVVMVYLLVNRIVASAERELPALGIAAAVLTAAASGLAAYGPSGLETPLFLLLVLGVFYALTTRHPVVAGVFVTLAGMTRPDGLLIAVLCGLWLIWAAIHQRHTWWAPAGYALGALVFAVPWTAWRVTYYGHLVPNAIAAKSGGSLGWQLGQGWHYLTQFSLVHLGFLLLALVTIVAMVARRGRGTPVARSMVWLVLVVTVAYTAFVTYAGGDWMPAWRLLAPVPPLIAVAAASAYGVLAKEGARRPNTRLVPLVASVLAGLSVLVTVASPNVLDRMHGWRTAISQLSEIGSWLGTSLQPGTVISTYANGTLSYHAGTQIVVVDVLGLTDEHIARDGQRDENAGPIGHIASDYDYVVNVRRPSVSVTTGNGYSNHQECGFDARYGGDDQVATFQRAGLPEWVTLYLRNDQAATLIADLAKDQRFVYVACPA
nr:hypothetical protein [Amycolatopsis sp.]